jgi:hypothetical protein
MKALSFEQIFLLILFVLLPLLNILIRRMTRHPERRLAEGESTGQVRRRSEPAPRSRPLPRATRAPEHEIQAPAVSTTVSRRRFSKRVTFETRRDVRRGIITMTILGPCRAFDPPG